MKGRCGKVLKQLTEGDPTDLKFSFLLAAPPAIETDQRRRVSRGGGDGGEGGSSASLSARGGGGGKETKGETPGANMSGAGADIPAWTTPVRSMAAFMATQTEHSPNQARTAPRRHPAQPVTMRAKSGGSTPTRGSDLSAYDAPRPPQASAGASAGGGGALVPGLCLFHRTLQDRA